MLLERKQTSQVRELGLELDQQDATWLASRQLDEEITVLRCNEDC
ncbi:MAG: hypothetical protein U9R79_05955 [Armatimonadota bacterium]|nr:hypothetical protein [Armatimonadota bacterium]